MLHFNRWKNSSAGDSNDGVQFSDESTFKHHKTSCRTLKFSVDGSGTYVWCSVYKHLFKDYTAHTQAQSLSYVGACTARLIQGAVGDVG